MKPAKFDPRHYSRTKLVNLFSQHFHKYFLILFMAKWNDFVDLKTDLSTETLDGPYRSRTVGRFGMAAAIHFRLHFSEHRMLDPVFTGDQWTTLNVDRCKPNLHKSNPYTIQNVGRCTAGSRGEISHERGGETVSIVLLYEEFSVEHHLY